MLIYYYIRTCFHLFLRALPLQSKAAEMHSHIQHAGLPPPNLREQFSTLGVGSSSWLPSVVLQDRVSNKWRNSTQPRCGRCRCWGRDQHRSSRGLSFQDTHQVVCMGEPLAKTFICISMQYSGQLGGRKPTLTLPPIQKLRSCRHKSFICTVTPSSLRSR